MIPKLIKYIWFSNDRTIPIEYEYNILYVHIQNPGYKIIIYSNDELQFQVLNNIHNIELKILENTDEHKKLNNFTIKSDYYRFEILRDGGFYFDTDILILKSLNDLLDYDNVFFQLDQFYYFESAAMAAKPNSDYIKCGIETAHKYMDSYNTFSGRQYVNIMSEVAKQSKEHSKYVMYPQSVNTSKEEAYLLLISPSALSNNKYGIHLRVTGKSNLFLRCCINNPDFSKLSLARKVVDECNEYLKTK